MERKQLCEFGTIAKMKLVEINKPQSWLIRQVREDTGQFLDSAYLCRIWTGDRKPDKIINSICTILEIDNPYDQAREQKKTPA